jgi:hypothetical protein
MYEVFQHYFLQEKVLKIDNEFICETSFSKIDNINLAHAYLSTHALSLPHVVYGLGALDNCSTFAYAASCTYGIARRCGRDVSY